MPPPDDHYPGADLVARAFPADGRAGLAIGVHGCGGAAGVVGTLAGALRPHRWIESRAAVSGLRRHGADALGAIPALAAWTMLHAGAAAQPAEQLTVHEAALALRELRTAFWTGRGLRPQEPLMRLLHFQLDVVDPHLLALMALPPRLWHRGVIACIRDARPEPDRRVAAIEGWLARPASPPPGYEVWWEHARAEALTVLAEVAAQAEEGPPPPVDVDALERLWDAPPFTGPPADDPPGAATGDA
ncbi:MAG: hypothetical protein IT200_07745 [Thermoleophilia bacterium]|nr:hypothetical protein [Thermoleophilia bacterium]